MLGTARKGPRISTPRRLSFLGSTVAATRSSHGEGEASENDRNRTAERSEARQSPNAPNSEHASTEPACITKEEAEQVDDRYALVRAGFSAYEDFSKQASENARKLALVGLAFTLLLGGVAKEDFGGDNAVDLEGSLIVAGVVLILALLLDIVQYIYGAAAFQVWSREEEKRLRRNDDALPADGFPARVNLPTTWLFWAKTLLVAVGYSALLYHLAFQIR